MASAQQKWHRSWVIRILTALLWISANGVEGSEPASCEKYVRDHNNPNAAEYSIGGVAFRIPIEDARYSPGRRVKTSTLSFYYSLDSHDLYALHSRNRSRCRGWCNDVLVMLTSGSRPNNVGYRSKAILDLSEGRVVDDPYMHLLFSTLRDTRSTSYWKVMPERKALLECGRENVASPDCSWAFDYSPSVETRATFGRKHLADAPALLNTMTEVIDCLRQE